MAPQNNRKPQAKPNSAKKDQNKDDSQIPTKPILWPSLEPLCPNSDLELHHLVPGQVVTISRFWTAALCKKYVAFLSSLPLVTTPGIPKRGDAVRVNDRFQIEDAEFAESLWSSTALKDLVTKSEEAAASEDERRQLWGGEILGLNPNIRIYRYRKGQFFDQHYDESNNLTHPNSTSTPARTTWTLLLYLTSATTGCKGGETVFYPEPTPSSNKSKQSRQRTQENLEPVIVGLETGMALLHRHGRECMLHEGREVTEGEKWVIRSDLCVKR